VRGREGVSERIFDDLLASRHQARNLIRQTVCADAVTKLRTYGMRVTQLILFFSLHSEKK